MQYVPSSKPEPKKPEIDKRKLFLIWGIPPIIVVLLFAVLILKLTLDGSLDRAQEEPRQEVTVATGDEDETSQPDEENYDATLDSTTDGTGDATTDQGIVTTEVNRELAFIAEPRKGNWKLLSRDQAFELEEDWKIFVIQKQKKIDYTIFSTDQRSWQAKAEDELRLVYDDLDKKTRDVSFDRSRKKHYALQLLSLKESEFFKAVEIIRLLTAQGYYAYLYRTDNRLKNKNSNSSQYYYRVRVGFFESEREARQVGDEILTSFSDQNVFVPDYWAVLPDYQELDDEFVDFGLQRNKPWVLQIDKLKDKVEAIRILKEIAPLTEIAFVSQKKGEEESYDYRIRVGFFQSFSVAEKMLRKIRSATKQKLTDAKIVKLRHSISPLEPEVSS